MCNEIIQVFPGCEHESDPLLLELRTELFHREAQNTFPIKYADISITREMKIIQPPI